MPQARRRQEEPGAPATHSTGGRRGARAQVAAAAVVTAAAAAASARPLRVAPATLHCAAELAAVPGFPGPRAHGRAPRTIAAASIVVPSPGASYGEAGEEGMRLEALPEE